MTARYQRIAITLYISVVMAIMLYILSNELSFGLNAGSFRPRPRPLWIPILSNGAIAAGLIFLETQLTGKSLPDLSKKEAAIHLGLRFFLVSTLILIGRGPFTVYMFYPILLFTFFTFGHRVAYGFAFFSSIIVLAFVARLSPGPFVTPSEVNHLIVYVLGLLSVILMANVLQQEWETNQQLIKANENLEESHTKLQEASTRVAKLAATDERNRLARDIHDSLGHHLIASRIQLEKAGMFLGRDINETATALGHAQRTISEALTEVRTSVKALREQADRFDFIPETNDLISRMRHHDLAIFFNLHGDIEPYSTFVQMTLYRIIQEGLTNIHKHANASRATIDLTFSPEQACLKIIDNGQGFNPIDGKQEAGYGLLGIRERVALVGGQYEIESDSQKGTTLFITVPKKNGIME